MDSKVTATLVVNFDSAGGGSLSAELDARLDGYNGGRTSFGSGDAPAFLVFASNDVLIETIEASAGNIEGLAAGTILVQEDLHFADVAEAGLSKGFYNEFSYKWLGQNLGAPTPHENNVTITAPGVGVLRVSYNALFYAFRITGIPYPLNGETTFPVLVVVTGAKQ